MWLIFKRLKVNSCLGGGVKKRSSMYIYIYICIYIASRDRLAVRLRMIG